MKLMLEAAVSVGISLECTVICTTESVCGTSGRLLISL